MTLRRSWESRPGFVSTLLQGRPRQIVCGPNTRILGSRRIAIRAVTGSSGRLAVGVTYYGFIDRRTPTLVNVAGELKIEGRVAIGRGAQWDVARSGRVTIGDRTSFSPLTRVVCQATVNVGSDCLIGWGTEFIDSPFHIVTSTGEDRPPSAGGIKIARGCWLAAGCLVLGGSVLAEGTVVAARSVVSGEFEEPNTLLAGSPARVVRRDVTWA